MLFKLYQFLNLFQPWVSNFLLVLSANHNLNLSSFFLALAAEPYRDCLPRDLKAWAHFRSREKANKTRRS
jgi:hypothetical protein